VSTINNNKISQWARKYRKKKKQRFCARQMKEFVEWSKLSPEELIKEAREKQAEGKVEKRVIDFYHYLIDQGKSEITAFDYTKAIRGFFKYHRVRLVFQSGELVEPERQKEDYRLKLYQIQAMVNAANLKNKAVILFLESTGLRVGDAMRLERNRIEPLLNEEVPIYIGPISTQKKRIQAHPFLHGSAVETLKKYLGSRSDNNPYLFAGKNNGHLGEQAVLKNIRQLFSRAGFTDNGTRIRTHCLRKFTIARMQDAGIETCLWKQLVGKKSGEETYSSNRLKEAYMKVLSRLDPSNIKNNHIKLSDVEKIVEEQKKEISDLKVELATLANCKTFELLKVFMEKRGNVLKESLAKSQPASQKINGELIETEPVKIEAYEILMLKALAQTLHKISAEIDEEQS